ncbi:stalk domain-containing protein [Paenibacillus roseipurpureus]|uniref:Stalk domain-containing protein n=1 Tax=Paenibacillus roseopurpureus TaxID=2918901 RepID=A0AA96LLP4_9BACL|nr:stalk domain-containing protein [Paenibacillus sp. MBLB1832]WNR43437.1 stalk domain-containing protein [Paenibacillus sp. MBLB1832]
MRKSPWNMLKMGVVSCALIVGVSAAVIPVAGIASAESASSQEETAQQVNSPVLAAPVGVKDVVLTSTSADVTTNIKVPQLTGMLDVQYQGELNDIILSHANKDLAALEKAAGEDSAKAKEAGFTFRPYGLTITYALKSDGTGNPAGVISLEITTYAATGGTGMPRLDTYNVLNAEHAQRVTLQDLLGANYKETVDAGVVAKIAEKPQNYFKDQFKGISSEQGFYVEKGDVVVVFPKYAIAPGSSGSPEFRFTLADNLTITPTEQRAKVELATNEVVVNADGVSLVPYRKVAEGLGYTVTWNPDTYSAELTKGAQWTSVTVGKDSYFFAKMAPKSLGAAPVIINESLYVPIAFVTNILHASATTDSAGLHIVE